MTVFVGTSGWQYRDWRRAFYPDGVPQRAWLDHYAQRFATVEVNNSFYRLPPPSTFALWAAGTPADFVVAPKFSRYLSHVRRLRDPAEPMHRFFTSAAPLGPKMGPVLLQLPPSLKADLGLLGAVLEHVPAGVRFAVEVRHDSWCTEALADLLAGHDAALVWADRKGRPVAPLWATASWAYVRLHEGTATPRPCYGRSALHHWAQRIAAAWPPSADAYVYFNNDPHACALANARTFASAVRAVGLTPTRVPGAGDVHVGAGG